MKKELKKQSAVAEVLNIELNVIDRFVLKNACKNIRDRIDEVAHQLGQVFDLLRPQQIDESSIKEVIRILQDIVERGPENNSLPNILGFIDSLTKDVDIKSNVFDFDSDDDDRTIKLNDDSELNKLFREDDELAKDENYED